MTRQALLLRLEGIESQLSPENLHRDGEASLAWVQRQAAALYRERNAVIDQLGRLPAPAANLDIAI